MEDPSLWPSILRAGRTWSDSRLVIRVGSASSCPARPCDPVFYSWHRVLGEAEPAPSSVHASQPASGNAVRFALVRPSAGSYSKAIHPWVAGAMPPLRRPLVCRKSQTFFVASMGGSTHKDAATGRGLCSLRETGGLERVPLARLHLEAIGRMPQRGLPSGESAQRRSATRSLAPKVG